MLTHLECTRCGEHYPADRPQTVCPKDGGILYARYDLPTIKRSFSSARLAGRTPTMWRYDAVLPAADPVSLGEGFTPMLPSREYPNVYIKDEGLNPTGSFKARGLSAAVTMARHFSLKKLAIPSAGNAAGALAAYAAAAKLEAHIFMPKDVPAANRIECDYYGANVTLDTICGGNIFRHKDVGFEFRCGSISCESPSGITGGRNGELFQGKVASHGDSGGESAGFEGSGWIESFVFYVDVGVLAAGKHGSESLAERNGISRGEYSIVAPHGGRATGETSGREGSLDRSKIVAGVEDAGIFRTDSLQAVGGIVLSAAGTLKMRQHDEAEFSREIVPRRLASDFER